VIRALVIRAIVILAIVMLAVTMQGKIPIEGVPPSAGEIPRIVVVAGPTASGKSSISVSLAKALAQDGAGAEVVSIDSVQIYREFDVGSAKTTDKEQEGVPHHLLSILDPSEKLDAKRFLSLARAAVSDICERGKVPIIVGGTTMYLTLLLHGLSEAPAADEQVRFELAKASDEMLYAELELGDPGTAKRLHPNDRVRVLRAVEALRTHGIPLSEINAAHAFRQEHYRALILVPCWPRDVLYERINQRTTLMLEQGLLEETRRLVTRYGEDIQGLRALGYCQALQVLEGSLSKDSFSAEVAQFTRRFAKRQMTFLRNEPGKRGWVVLPSELGSSVPPPKVTKTKGQQDFQALQLGLPRLAQQVRSWLGSPKESNEIWYLDAGYLSSPDCRPGND